LAHFHCYGKDLYQRYWVGISKILGEEDYIMQVVPLALSTRSC